VKKKNSRASKSDASLPLGCNGKKDRYKLRGMVMEKDTLESEDDI
jgi:hypothetical protein